MIKNYITITLRNIKKYKLYSFINITGLALGLACALVILLWVNDELSYDRFFKDASKIYRVNWDYKWNNNEGVGSTTPPPLAKSLLSDIPSVTAATRIYKVPQNTVRYDDRFFNEDGIISADSNFFSFFNYTFIEGNANTALKEPSCVVLTETISHKYFGNESPLNKIVTIGKNRIFSGLKYENSFKVTGVIKDPPHNSHIQFDMITSISSNPEVAYFDWSWIWMQVVTYVKIDNPSNVRVIESKIPTMVKKYAPSAFKRVGFSYDELIKNGGRWNFLFQPLEHIYLESSDIGNRIGPLGDKKYVYVFSLIAVFVLLIACINFMNLTTARFETRTREIGVRKVLGSSQKMLSAQFLFESVIFSVLAMILAVCFVELLRPAFNNLTGKSLAIDFSSSPLLLSSVLILTLLVGLVAGSYPAFYMSSFKPILILKGTNRTEGRAKTYRNLLVVFQFVITTCLIASTLLVNKQISYMNEADLGFNKENLLVISNMNSQLGNNAEVFRDDLLNNPGVINASVSTGVPPNWGFEDLYKIQGKSDEQFDLISYMTDDNFISTMGIDIIKGRGFSKDFSTDARSIILNESAVKTFGLEDPIGKTVTYPSMGDYKIIGIVRDFNFLSLHSPITPFALFHSTSKSYKIPDSYVVVRISGNNVKNTINVIEEKWKEFAPASPFKFSFLDDNLNAKYLSEQRLERMFTVFSGLTIFIACIGLLGLVAFSTSRRTKEIGIRKVLGASAFSILSIITKDLLKIVIVANLIACPIAWYAMNKWLQDFAYHVKIGWTIFLTAGLMTIVIGFITISILVIKAATVNPVKSLRYE